MFANSCVVSRNVQVGVNSVRGGWGDDWTVYATIYAISKRPTDTSITTDTISKLRQFQL